jgi:mannose-6-phosphate isomerase-like protein (cupin superfamily)
LRVHEENDLRAYHRWPAEPDHRRDVLARHLRADTLWLVLADAPPSDLHRHEGAELIYVLSGKLAVRVEDEETILSAGDAMYFDSGAAHSYRRHGRSGCAAIVVVAVAPSDQPRSR